jgi:hypothetical protein
VLDVVNKDIWDTLIGFDGSKWESGRNCKTYLSYNSNSLGSSAFKSFSPIAVMDSGKRIRQRIR